jgi:hypothetical protein
VINELFEGHTINFLECVNVDYTSSRRESFMDLQLDVKGCPDIYASFDKCGRRPGPCGVVLLLCVGHAGLGRRAAVLCRVGADAAVPPPATQHTIANTQPQTHSRKHTAHTVTVNRHTRTRRRYTEVEMMVGDNQYKAEGHGLQDARKGVLFDGLPPVLQLQLKRFEYDFQRDTMVKVRCARAHGRGRLAGCRRRARGVRRRGGRAPGPAHVARRRARCGCGWPQLQARETRAQGQCAAGCGGRGGAVSCARAAAAPGLAPTAVSLRVTHARTHG